MGRGGCADTPPAGEGPAGSAQECLPQWPQQHASVSSLSSAVLMRSMRSANHCVDVSDNKFRSDNCMSIDQVTHIFDTDFRVGIILRKLSIRRLLLLCFCFFFLFNNLVLIMMMTTILRLVGIRTLLSLRLHWRVCGLADDVLAGSSSVGIRITIGTLCDFIDLHQRRYRPIDRGPIGQLYRPACDSPAEAQWYRQSINWHCAATLGSRAPRPRCTARCV